MHCCIVGTSRCGTTLLRKLLHDSGEISLFNETHWIPKMFEVFGTQKVSGRQLLHIAENTTWDSGKDLFTVNAEHSCFSSREELVKAFEDALNQAGPVGIPEFSEIFARVAFNRPPRWGDKTPDYGYYMGLLQSIWPACRFVHIVRSGVPTALSMSRHSGCQLLAAADSDNWCSLSFDRLYEKYQRRDLPIGVYIASWRRRLARIRDEASRLATAMRDNPSLRVLVQCGYTDLATPPDGIKHSVRHMFSIPADRRKAIEFAWYDAGHMFYLNEPDLAKMRKDLVRFVQGPAKAP